MKGFCLMMTVIGLVSSCDVSAAQKSVGRRHVLSLNGAWDLAQGAMDTLPSSFAHTVPVPGLVDMAEPAFTEVGMASEQRKAFWYRRTFTLDADPPSVAVLKLHKAKFGAQVFMNGVLIGEHMPCFTPGYFDVQKALRPAGEVNELVIRIGAFHDVLPKTVQWGYDSEKSRYLPGIYDSVELILSGAPFVKNVQIAPDMEGETVRVLAELHNVDKAATIDVAYRISEARSGKVVAQGRVTETDTGPFAIVPVDLRIPMTDARRWSPEDPFLYELELLTDGDGIRERFGMRSFRFDTATGRALLNGKPYYMRGSNICIFRFFEDAEREDRPWDREWVRRLHQKIKSMNWNSLRYCIGFPPEFWYDIADEEGILIQDEFPIWYGNPKRAGKWWAPECKAEHVAAEYREWMEERWNHPCVVIWDAQNETVRKETGDALRQVRSLDLSNRPWDNGWSAPQHPDDCQESHPYLFATYQGETDVPPAGPLSDKLTAPLYPRNGPTFRSGARTKLRNAIIINEYAWIWLNRDGSPTTLTDEVYKKAFPDADTAEKRRYHYARWLAALTEYWRAHRQCAGVLHFCALGYSRPEEPRGQTSDPFIDLGLLTFEPMFEEYVRDAFAPVGLMINYWNSKVSGGLDEKIEVYVINDLDEDWRGSVQFRVEREGRVLQQDTVPCRVAAYGREILSFEAHVPAESGRYKLIAEYRGANDDPVRSFRDVDVP